jgi:hypothetical protein
MEWSDEITEYIPDGDVEAVVYVPDIPEADLGQLKTADEHYGSLIQDARASRCQTMSNGKTVDYVLVYTINHGVYFVWGFANIFHRKKRIPGRPHAENSLNKIACKWALSLSGSFSQMV